VNGTAPAPGTAWILRWDKSGTMVLDAVAPPGSLASRQAVMVWTGTYSGCK